MQNKLKEYGIDNEKLAQLLEYKSTNAFNSSSARRRIKRAIERIIIIVETDVNNTWKSKLLDLTH